MYLVKHKRDMEHHQAHVIRVRQMQAHVDTSTPSSLGLKHLATRPKKQQLIDDRHQQIAKENRKLMEKMTKIMASNNIPPPPIKLGSLNEVERKLEVQRLNFENSLLLDRIKNTPAVIDRTRMDKDFERHRVVGGQLRRRQLAPIDSLVDPLGTSTSKKGSPSPQRLHAGPSSTFDAQSYITQLAASYSATSGNGAMASGMPLQTMSEYRANVISRKRLESPPGLVRQPYPSPNTNTQQVRSSSSSASEARVVLQHNPTPL